MDLIFFPLLWALLYIFLWIRGYIVNTKHIVNLMSSGEYDKCLSIFNKKLNNKFLNKTAKNSYIYNIALIYHRRGQLEEARVQLERLNVEKLDRNLQGAYYGLYAINLLLLEKDFTLCEDYLSRSFSILRKPLTYLYFAYLYSLQNNLDKAKSMIEEYHTNEKTKDSKKQGFSLFKTRLIYDLEFESLIKNLFIGLWYKTINQKAEAIECFNKACLYPYDNIYKAKAFEQLMNLELDCR